MQIKKIRIGNFGKFSNKEIDFCKGLNVIYGENESGKSTIHAFIKGMLFGIEIKRGSTAKDDVYSKYLPWDVPGAFSGSLDFEHEGVNYRISRTFLKNARSCTCTNLDLGKEIFLADDKITGLIPELNESNYFNTIVLGQQSAKTEKLLADNVGNYIANLALAKTGEVDIPGALDILKKKAKEINSKVAETDENELNRWREELSENAAEIDEEIAGLKGRIDAEKNNAHRIEADIKDIEDRLQEAQKRSENTNNVYERDYSAEMAKVTREAEEQIANILNESEAKLQNLKADTKAKFSKLDLQKQERLFVEKSNLDSRKKMVREKRDIIDEKRSGLDTSINKLRWESDERRQKLDALKQERTELEPVETELAKKKGSYKNGSIIGAILLVLGGALAYLFSNTNKAGIIIGLVLMVAGILVLLMSLIKKKEADIEIEKTENRLQEIGKEERELQAGVMEADAASDKLEEELKKLGLEVEELKDRENSAERNFESATRDAEADALKEKNDLEMTLQRLESEERLGVERRLAEVRNTKEQALSKIASEQNADRERQERELLIKANREEQCRIELQSKQNELEGVNRLIAANEEQLTGLSEKSDENFEKLEGIQSKLQQAREFGEQAKLELGAIELARNTISRMSELIYDSFGRQLNDMLSRLAGKLTNGKYTQVMVNKDLSLKFMGSLDYQSADGLSVGTMEQLYLALRLSIGELFFGNTEVPVILDEPLAYYDENRAKAALKEMAEAGKQIMLFTCRSFEARELTAMGEAFNLIRL